LRHNISAFDSYSPGPATDTDDGASSSRQQDNKATSVEAVELADDEGKLEIDDQHEEDDNENNDGGKTPPASSTSVQGSNKKDQLDTGEGDYATCQ
jgi:hypothetical protein